MGKPVKRVIEQPLDHGLIPLTRGQIAVVDKEDYPALSRHNWCALWTGKCFYAARRDESNSYLLMHRELLKCAPSELADHKDGNTLDNRRHNIRKCTLAQNNMNRRPRSKWKGIHFHKCQQGKRKWRARIAIQGRGIFLGYFAAAIEAATAYNEGARKYHGEFARLNEVPSGS